MAGVMGPGFTSTAGMDMITMGATWVIFPLLEIPRSRKYVDISSLCQERLRPSSGSSRLFCKESMGAGFRGFRPLRAARGLLSSKLRVLKYDK